MHKGRDSRAARTAAVLQELVWVQVIFVFISQQTLEAVTKEASLVPKSVLIYHCTELNPAFVPHFMLYSQRGVV